MFKKRKAVGMAVVGLVVIVAVVAVLAVSVKERSFSVTKTGKYTFSETPSSLRLVDSKPCVLAGGTAYLYEDGSWNVISEESISELYMDELFCAVTTEGVIIADLPTQEEYESYPLTTAGVYHNAEEVMKQTAGKAVAQLGAGIFNEQVLVLYDNGETELFVNGTAWPIAEELTVEEVSGNFLRTDTGEVYLVRYVFRETSSTGSVSLKQVFSGEMVSISASSTAYRCVGVRSDGSVEIYSDIAELFTPDLPEIEKICMDFDDNYCVAVGTDGKAHFSSEDPELEEEIDAYLDAQSGTVLEAACGAYCIAVLFEDGRVLMMDFH